MIIVAEPTYFRDDHVAVNGSVVRALTLAFGKAVFAATPEHHARLKETIAGEQPDIVQQEIDVLPPGGVHLRRMRSQWRTLAALVRQHRSAKLLLLSAGPETLFVARLLAARFTDLRVFVVMHGNLSTVTGWRSRDPRRRMIDLRSGLRISQHPRIRLIVLEEHIREAAQDAGFGHDFLVWPLPSVEHEQAPAQDWVPGNRLRLTFVGTANRRKGFAEILALQRATETAYDWTLAGSVSDEFGGDEIGRFAVPQERLSRADYVAEVRRADYAVMSFGVEYQLTASASFIDCLAQRKPLIAVTNSFFARLEQQYGSIGHICADHAAMAALLAEPERLRDMAAYAGFQRALDAIHADRSPARLAARIERDLRL